MSVESVLSRVSQLQAMMATGTSSAPAPAATGSFSSALASATTGDAGQSATTAALASPLGTAPAGGPGAALASPLGAGAPGGPGAALASPLGPGPAAAPAATGSDLPATVPYRNEITAAARANGIDPALLAGLIKQESGFNPNAGSGAGARGLTQLMPGTASGLGVTNLLDPAQSIKGGAKYLKQQLDAFGGDVTRALAAYNAGPGAVKRFGGVPPYAETQNYVRVVQANAASFRSSTT